jgi:uncharacterized protein
MALPLDWGIPQLTPLNRAWFTSGAFAVQRCAECRALQHPPEEICHACGAMAFDSVELSPRGTVHSYTVVHHAAHPALADSVPYTVVLVALDDERTVRVVGNTDDPVAIGDSVEAFWEERVGTDGETVLLPFWRRVSTE